MKTANTTKQTQIFKELKTRIDRGKRKFTNEELKTAYKRDWTVAHQLAMKGFTDFTDAQMRIADKWGWTIAYYMAEKGYRDFTMEHLKLKNHKGQTVADIINETK